MSAEPIVEEELWIEFLEGELPKTEANDLKLVLKNSLIDQVLCQSLSVTKDILLEANDVAMPEDGNYYMGLHSKIMKSVEPKNRRYKTKRALRKKSLELLGLFI